MRDKENKNELPDNNNDSTTFKEKFKQKWKKWRVTRWIIFIILVVGLVVEGYLLVNAKMTNVDDLHEQLQITTDIMDSEGNVAGHLSDEQGTYVTLEEISPEMQQAVISTEDKRFYNHRGFDIIGIARAAVGYILNGEIVGGGSTLSQQLAKNSFLTNEQNLVRKMKELFLALEIEKTYTKDQILEMYLNHSYFGRGVYGVEDASYKYFGKTAAELTLSEAAVLTAALKGPSIYNPVDDYDATLERRNVVLQLMADNEFITQENADLAIATVMPQQDNKIVNDDYQYPWYFDAVIEEAINKFGLTEDEIMNGGYQIYTNLDQSYQAELSSVYDQTEIFPTGPTGNGAQSASVVLHPETGGVLATVGGTGEHIFRGFNRATQLVRSPASAIKPLIVYTAALENGFTPTSIIPDEVQEFGTDNYSVENYDFITQGEIMLWQALSQSKNTSAVWLMNELGIDKTINKLNEFGIETTEEDRNLSTALSLSSGTSPIEMASAYTAFANQGVRSEGYFITQITDKEGNIIVEEQEPEQNEVTSPEVAQDMTSMMLATYDAGGTGAAIEPYGYEIAGKTGTQEVDTEADVYGSNDEWMMAYTPDMVVATWYGFDNTDAENYLWYGSPNSSYYVSEQIMQNLIAASPQTPFDTTSAASMYAVEEEESTEESSSSESSEQPENDSDSNVITDLFESGREFFEGLFAS